MWKTALRMCISTMTHPHKPKKKSKAHSLETIRDKKRKAFTQLFSYSSGVCGRTRLLGFWGVVVTTAIAVRQRAVRVRSQAKHTAQHSTAREESESRWGKNSNEQARCGDRSAIFFT